MHVLYALESAKIEYTFHNFTKNSISVIPIAPFKRKLKLFKQHIFDNPPMPIMVIEHIDDKIVVKWEK